MRRLQFGHARAIPSSRTSRATSGPIGRCDPNRSGASWSTVSMSSTTDWCSWARGSANIFPVANNQVLRQCGLGARRRSRLIRVSRGASLIRRAAMSSWSERTSKPKPSFRGAIRTSRCVADLMIESRTSEWCPSGLNSASLRMCQTMSRSSGSVRTAVEWSAVSLRC